MIERISIEQYRAYVNGAKPESILIPSRQVNAKAGSSAGKRDDLGIYVRSRWEANFCRYLKWLQARGDIHCWEYEPDTFWFETIKRGTRSYTPDFKIWDKPDSEPYYYEVKGWMDPKSQTKLKRMAKYYPHIKIVLIEQEEYNAIKKWSTLIPNWE